MILDSKVAPTDWTCESLDNMSRPFGLSFMLLIVQVAANRYSFGSINSTDSIIFLYKVKIPY